MKDYKVWTAKQRMQSLRYTNKAKAMGLLSNPTECCFCGQTKGILHTHNMDYSVTLEFVPKMIAGVATEEEIKRVKSVLKHVCWRCHMMIHRAEDHPLSSERYFERVRNGERFRPVFRANAWEELDEFMID